MNPSSSPTDEPTSKPGKIRTWWHPLLAGVLRWQLGSQYQLQEEVPIGQKPLQIDILLLQQQQGPLSEHARHMLAGLVERLGEYTLIEFKSPSDTLSAGDWQTFLAYALLYRVKKEPLLDPSRLHLVVMAPKLTGPYREEMQLLGVTVQEELRGIWRLQGATLGHPTWLLETDELADRDHPLMLAFSPQWFTHRLALCETLIQAGYTDLMVYIAQQICQFFLLGKDFVMQHLDTEEEMGEVLKVLFAQPPFREFLKQLPLEARLSLVSVEDRLTGLSEEELLKGLPPEKIERLRKLLQQPESTKADNGG